MNSVKEQDIWNEYNLNRKIYPVSSMELRDLGLKKDSLQFVETLDELRNNPPNLVIAECKIGVTISQNNSLPQHLAKGNSYIMSLGVYQQIHIKPDTKARALKPSKIKFRGAFRPYIGQDLTDKTLLVFRTGGIGDLLFIQPNLIYLKEKYPSCYIKFACGGNYQPMVRNWECVDEVIDLPFKLSHFQDADYHAIFEGVIERCGEAKNTNSYKLFTKWLGLNLPEEKLIPIQKPNDDILESVKLSLKSFNLEENNFILFQLRSSTPIRTPSLIFWSKIINELTDRGHKVVIIDRSSMKEKIDRFIQNLKNKENVVNICELSNSLDFTIAITSLAKLVVATDSALNHIAASLDVKCYGIYGPFPGDIRLSTYKKSKWVDAKRHCSPCFLHSNKPCPEAGKEYSSPCYENIDITQTCKEIEDFIND